MIKATVVKTKPSLRGSRLMGLSKSDSSQMVVRSLRAEERSSDPLEDEGYGSWKPKRAVIEVCVVIG